MYWISHNVTDKDLSFCVMEITHSISAAILSCLATWLKHQIHHVTMNLCSMVSLCGKKSINHYPQKDTKAQRKALKPLVKSRTRGFVSMRQRVTNSVSTHSHAGRGKGLAQGHGARVPTCEYKKIGATKSRRRRRDLI